MRGFIAAVLVGVVLASCRPGDSVESPVIVIHGDDLSSTVEATLTPVATSTPVAVGTLGPAAPEEPRLALSDLDYDARCAFWRRYVSFENAGVRPPSEFVEALELPLLDISDYWVWYVYPSEFLLNLMATADFGFADGSTDTFFVRVGHNPEDCEIYVEEPIFVNWYR